MLRHALIPLTLLLTLPTPAQAWTAKEQIKPYAISGTTPGELYASIGREGPRLRDGRRTIAHTTFDLKWRRKYQPQPGSGGTACTLASARPFFTIIYTIPKPSAKLSGPTARKWEAFRTGILAHEKVHGQHAREMVDQIIATTVGLTVKNDPKCRKIRAKVLAQVKTAYGDYGAKARAFDRVEMGTGGTVRQMVNGFVRNR